MLFQSSNSFLQGKELETKLKDKKPGELTDDLRITLGMPIGPVRLSAQRKFSYLMKSDFFLCSMDQASFFILCQH